MHSLAHLLLPSPDEQGRERARQRTCNIGSFLRNEERDQVGDIVWCADVFEGDVLRELRSALRGVCSEGVCWLETRKRNMNMCVPQRRACWVPFCSRWRSFLLFKDSSEPMDSVTVVQHAPRGAPGSERYWLRTQFSGNEARRVCVHADSVGSKFQR